MENFIFCAVLRFELKVAKNPYHAVFLIPIEIHQHRIICSSTVRLDSIF